MIERSSTRWLAGAAGSAAAVALVGAGTSGLVAAPDGPRSAADEVSPPAVEVLRPCAPADAPRTPEEVPLRPTQDGVGAEGRMALRMSDSPYGVTVSSDGRYVLHVTVEVSRLRRRPGAAYVVWAATPELDRVVKLGALGDDARVAGDISFNKFLVFVSEETSADVETWSGPILLTGLSPSGRMHTMAGHGPFEGVDCSNFF